MEVWENPTNKINDVIKMAVRAIEEAPTEFKVNVVLRDRDAMLFYFIKEIVKCYANLSEEEAVKYLVQGGVQREMERFAFVEQLIEAYHENK